MRRRPAAFVALLVLSALAVAVSALTPMLLRAVQADALVRTFAAAPLYERSVTAVGQATNGDAIGDAVYASQQVVSADAETRLWGAETDVIESPDVKSWSIDGQRGAETSYFTLTLDPRCPGLTIVSGTCTGDGVDVVMPASTARRRHVGVGAQVLVGKDPTTAQVLDVVGIYDDTKGYGRVLAAPDALTGTPLTNSSGSLLLGTRNVEKLGYDFTSISSISIRTPVAIADVSQVRLDVASMEHSTDDYDAAEAGASVRTGLTAVLDRVGAQQAAAATLTTATTLEALALSWFALAFLIQRISRVRAVEWGIGRTRGVKRRQWLATVFLEPFVALVLGAVLGFPLAIALARLAAGATLDPEVSVEPFLPPVLAAAGLAFAGSLVALVAASVRSARLPLPALLRETTEPRRLSRLALVGQVGVVLVTATVVWAVVTQPTISGPQVALLTPSLIALVVGIVALRVSVVLVRRATARPPRTLGGLVVGRQLARAPSNLSGAVMVAVGLALAAYLVSLSLVTLRLQSDRADADVGATSVLKVVLPAGGSLRDLVRRADPSGTAAMAVLQAGGSPSGTNRLIAVDTPRLAAVSTWRAAWWGGDAATLVRGLDPATTAPLTFRGTRLSLAVSGIGPGLSQPTASDDQVRLTGEVAGTDGWRPIDFGLLREGTLRAATSGCASGCRLISLSVLDPNSTTTGPFGVTFTLNSIATNAQPASDFAAWLTSAHSWRERIADRVDPTHPEYAHAEARGRALRLEFDANVGGVSPTVEPVVGPAILPALVANGTGAQSFPGLAGSVYGADLNARDLLLKQLARPTVLPRFGDQGVLVDIGQLALISDTVGSGAVDEVWLAPGPHPGVLAALRSEGVRVVSTETLDSVRAEYLREAPVQSLELTSVTAGTALLLTLLALVGARSVGSAPRRRDTATLRVAGVRGALLGRLSALEFALPTAVGAVLGVAAGVVAYVVTVTRLPLTAGDGSLPPSDLLPPVAALLLLVAGGVAVAAVIGLLAGGRDARSSA